MSAELVAIACLFAFLCVAMFIATLILRRKEQEWLGTIQNLRSEFEEVAHSEIQKGIDAFSESFNGILGEPTIKKAFSIIGSQGGEAKAESSLVDSMATDILDSPQFAGIRMGAEALGLHIDEYIEEHGAVKTIAAAQQLSRMLGVDLMKVDLSNLAGSLSGPGSSGSRDNPYLRR